MSDQQPDPRGPALFLVLLLIVGLLVVSWGAGQGSSRGSGTPGAGIAPEAEETTPVPSFGPFAAGVPPWARAEPESQLESETESEAGAPEPDESSTEPDAAPEADPPATLPGGRSRGRSRIFGRNHFLVAYYGTGQTPALGVLGESRPATMHRRLMRAAKPFAGPGRPVQPVYELIVTIADAHPGPDGDFSHDIPRSEVRRYIRAADRRGALLLLDLQPGRSGFLATAKRWEWALRHPWVGIALDPEWRMGRREVPGRAIGQVRAAEVNRTSAWLARLVRRHDLPEKLFVLHQFRRDMLPDIGAIRSRPGLAMVQHVDGFGTPQQKRATYRHVARPRQFTMGFKLFYDEDVRRMGARDVHRLRPRVRFVSFQ